MIWQELIISWGGQEYTCRPTLELIARIESRPGCSIGSLIMRASDNDIPSAAACHVLAEVLKYAGLQITADQIFEQSMGGISAEVKTAAMTVIFGLLPPRNTDDSEPVTDKKKP